MVEDSDSDPLPYASPLELLRAPRAAYDGVADVRMVGRVGALAWVICAVLTAAMLPFWPPSHTVGSAGWGLAAASLIAGLAGAAWLLRASAHVVAAARITSVGWIVALGVLEWATGGGAHYTSLIVLPLVFVGASQALGRVVLTFVIAGCALVPGLAASGGASRVLIGDLVTVVVWLCLGTMTVLWTAGVRWQRLALRHSEEQAHRRARRDAVTGLGSRHKLVGDLEALLAAGTSAVLALFDLNGFKSYNDSFGHPAGDALLARLGARLAAGMGEAARAYRLGGDEFVVLAPGQRVATVVHRGCACLHDTGQGFAVSAAGGGIALGGEPLSAVEALRRADQEMYAHKQRRRASVAVPGTRLLVALLAERHPALAAHCAAVAEHAAAVGESLGLEPAELAQLRLAAELHDVGKLAIPDAILAQTGALSPEDLAFVHRHTVIGERIVAAVPALAPVAALVRSHHERVDGRGYPDGLSGERIPLAARIIAVCDAYDAMTSERPHRAARGPEAAVMELRSCAGTQFDAQVVAAFTATPADGGRLPARSRG